MSEKKTNKIKLLSAGLVALSSLVITTANAQDKTQATIQPQKISIFNSINSKVNSFFDSEHDKYKYLNAQFLSADPEYQQIFFENKKADLKTTRNLANYISEKYKIKLPQAEEIVLHSFKEAINNNLEPLLMLSVIGIESSYKKESRSHVGAVGLTQVLPTWHLEKIVNLKQNDGLDIFSVPGNIKVGTQILKEYLERSNGNMTRALQRYNGSLHDKTAKYSKKVFAKLNILEKVASM